MEGAGAGGGTYRWIATQFTWNQMYDSNSYDIPPIEPGYLTTINHATTASNTSYEASLRRSE
jgi:hypothetical protein